MVSGGIWAFHFGYDNNGWPSMERAAQLIENSGTSSSRPPLPSPAPAPACVCNKTSRACLGAGLAAAWLGTKECVIIHVT